MRFTKVDSLDSSKPAVEYLRISDLTEGLSYTKVALVSSAQAGLTKASSGYAKFFLKDVDSNVVMAFLFDVKDFAVSGITLNQLQGKPVEVKFIAQLYNGSMSLLIDGSFGVREWKGEFDREAFVGKIEFDEDAINRVGQMVYKNDDWKIPISYKLLSVDTIGQGRVGAFVKQIEMALQFVLSSGSLFGEDFGDVLRVFFIAVDCLFWKNKQSDTSVMNIVERFDLVVRCSSKYRDDPLYPVILDTVKAVLGEGSPQHLVSHVISRAFNQALEVINLSCINKSLVVGASKHLGGDVVLLKY